MRITLYEILEDRTGKGSIVVTSQLPIASWYDKFGDPTLAEACLDRLTGNAVKINIKGVSWTKKRK